MLQAVVDVAPSDILRCYKAMAVVLPSANGGATNKISGCNQREAEMQLPMVDGATNE